MGSHVDRIPGVVAGTRAAQFTEDGALHVAIIENSALIRGSLARAILGSLQCSVSEFSTTNDFLTAKEDQARTIVILSFASRPCESVQTDINLIVAARPISPTIVFAQAAGLDAALFALNCGAKGFIPITTGWTLAVEAIRIIGAGGTYIPLDCLIAAQPSARIVQNPAPTTGVTFGVTLREISVLRAIQQGKPNKVIAHDLNISESTVKAHIRHIMFKSQAKNRTELAVRSAAILKGT
jgi:DNA-binding NarL/FixJ family response regulator